MERMTRGLQGAVFSVLVLTLMLIPVQGHAQEQYETQQANPTGISIEQIAAFAKAQIQIAQIQQKYEAMLSKAATAEEQQNIVQKSNEEMVAAIQALGLNVELYNTILAQAQNDPELKKRVSQIVESLQ